MEKINLPKDIEEIMKVLMKSGFEVFAVGGCIRDSILGKTPDDWDLSTLATPDEMKEVFFDTDIKTYDTGIKHGTITAVLRKTVAEITTYRRDGEYSDSRRPDKISFSKSIEEDLIRRDFTVNALAYNEDGGILDITGGIKDIDKKIVRAVGDPYKRFSEDALRILRMFRFSAVLGFKIEENTFKAGIELRDALKKISKERIRDEFSKILLSEKPSDTVRLMAENGFMKYILPEYEDMIGFEQHSHYHNLTVDEHTLVVLDNAPPKLTLRLAALLHDIGKPRVFYRDGDEIGHFKGHQIVGRDMSGVILRRLRYPNKQIDDVLKLVREHDNFLKYNTRQVKRAIARVGEELIDDLILLQRADGIGKHPLVQKRSVADLDGAQKALEEIRKQENCFKISDLKVSGADLIACGIEQGPDIGRILNKMLEKVLDEELANDREELLEYAQKKMKG